MSTGRASARLGGFAGGPTSTDRGRKNMKFGSHMSMAGGHDRAVRSAHALGFSTVQVFTKSNNQWRAAALTDAHVRAFREALAETGVADPVAHASYLINLGSPDDALWEKSIASLAVEIERGEALGISDLVIHPGAHVGQGEEAGLERIARGLDETHRRTRGVALRIALETTAGQGTCLGHRFEHLGRIVELVREPERLGVCVDTCHIFAAGYPLGTDSEYSETMDALEQAVGTGRVRVLHLNDSVKALGSRVDRHAGIGRGQIGLGAFGRVLNDPRFRTLPMILETPKGEEGGEDLDAINLRRLRGLVGASAVTA
jgi:deoxyribonuclease-4